MMINKRLIGVVPDSKKYIAGNVALQWLALICSIVFQTSVASVLAALLDGSASTALLVWAGGAAGTAVCLRFLCTLGASRMSFLSSRAVKRTLREQITRKLLRLGASYRDQVSTSEVVQESVEGVEQLETYFGSYLPQFFFAMLAPVTLFVYLSTISFLSAVVLLVCVPLIPVSIAAVQTWAKKLLGKYWGQYTALGDTFLENLQGLTVLKIYQADEYKNQQMNEEAERFRKITMKVLTMQLNSITIMDLIAYGGAALGVILAATQHAAGKVTFSGALLVILLAADFFLPMRQLGSFFHVAMNGMAASDRIFALLDLPEPVQGTQVLPRGGAGAKAGAEAGTEAEAETAVGIGTVCCSGLRYSYTEDREVLHGISLEIPAGGFAAVVGESGCGKSTLAGILMGRNKGYQGSVTIGGMELRNITEESLLRECTYVGSQSYLFKGTVRENLQMAKGGAADEELWAALEQAKLADFLRGEQGLETQLQERGANLSGGQRQRLALARALLRDSSLYIFDEATSNIDVESENDIVAEIHRLAQTKTKTVLLISHRLANSVGADRIWVMDAGQVAESGTHGELLQQGGLYARLWAAQQALEHFGEEAVAS